ncbi:MAG: CXXX repeat peptide modification system protein [Peptococcaceae bacterium]|nr:CXXX repeat peptide modification system protein [Peptococcaceae bacterium]
MHKEIVGAVTEEEKKQVMQLHERIIALDELILAINNTLLSKESRDELYEKIVNDMGRTKMSYQAWWDNMNKKYNWKSVKEGNWNIDFQTNEIFLG